MIMMKKVLVFLWGIALFILIIFLILLLVLFFRKQLFKDLVEDYLKRKTNIEIQIGQINYEFLPFRVEANFVRLSMKSDEDEINISLRELSLAGDLKRLIKRKKPFLDSIEGRGISLEARLIKKAEINLKERLAIISEIMGYVNKIRIREMALNLVTQSNLLSTPQANLFCQRIEGHENFRYSLSMDNGEFERVAGDFSGEGTIFLEGIFSLKESFIMEGEGIIEKMTLSFPNNNFPLERIWFNFGVMLDPEKKKLYFTKMKMSLPQMLEASFRSEIELLSPPSIFFSSKIEICDLKSISELLKRCYKPVLNFSILEGKAYLNLDYARKGSSMKGEIKASLKLNPTHFVYRDSEFSLSHRIRGAIKAEGSLLKPKLSGFLILDRGRILGNEIEVENSSLRFSFSGSPSQIKAKGIEGRLGVVSFIGDGEDYRLEGVDFFGMADIDLGRKEFKIDALRMVSPPLPSLSIQGRLNLHSPEKGHFKIETESFKFSRISLFFSYLLPDFLQRLEPEARCDFEAELGTLAEEREKLLICGKINLNEASFSDQALSLAAEGISSKINLRLGGRLGSKDFDFKISVEISQGEFLWKTYYVDLKRNPLELSLNGSYSSKAQRFFLEKAEAFLFDLGKIEASASFEAPHFSLNEFNLKNADFKLSPLYNLFVKGKFETGLNPFLRGNSEISLSLRKVNGVLTLKGEIGIRDFSLEYPETHFLVKNIEAEIPFLIGKSQFIGEQIGEQYKNSGYIFIERISLPFFSLGALRISLYSEKNSISFEPFSLDLPGGKIKVGRFTFVLLPSLKSFKANLSVYAKDFSLSEIFWNQSKIRMEGRANLELQNVEITPDGVRTEGQAELDVFGGRLVVKNIGFKQPFSKRRKIFCDIEIEDLDLEKLTDSVPFGRVTGIIKGRIADIIFSNGQPESFTLSLESVKRKEVAQKFSLKAVDDVAIISSGEKATLGRNRWITSFVSDLGYEKIGIFCSLKNDVFTLRGLILEKGKEYLIKGSWIFGLNVINMKPGNRIRFMDMLNRLKRIGGSKAPK